MGNPSIAPNREEKGMLRRKTHGSKTVKSKHMFKSNNTVTAAGNGKTRDQQWSGRRQQTHRLGYKVETEIEGVIGGVADSISLRASGVVSEQRLFQVKNEKKKKIFRSDFVLPTGEHCDRI